MDRNFTNFLGGFYEKVIFRYTECLNFIFVYYVQTIFAICIQEVEVLLDVAVQLLHIRSAPGSCISISTKSYSS